MRALIPAVAIALFSTGISAQTPDTNQALVQQYSERIAKQLSKMPEFETLQLSYQNPLTVMPSSHMFFLRLGSGIEMVTEGHSEDGVFEQKDYYFEAGKVYALRVSNEVPCMDGKMKRVTENYFFIQGGMPFHRTMISIRVPLTEEEPDLSKAKEKAMPLPPDLEGWGDRITARAYAVARTFQPGRVDYTFGRWGSWLLEGAPPEGTGEPARRTGDWLPPADTTVLPIGLSASPEGFYEIGWGYEKGPVDWKALSDFDPSNTGPQFVMFSTKLAKGKLSPELEDDGCFLLNRISGKTIAKLGVYHPGERQRFNLDELIVHWSPASTCFATIKTQKWFTESGEIAWIKDGKCEGANDILKPLHDAATEAVLKSKHPAVKRLRENRDNFDFTLLKIMVEDDGSFEAKVMGRVPRDDEPSGEYVAIIKGVFTPKPPGESAALKVVKTTIPPPRS